ncbi:hypothetical protein [Bacillus mycoides]|uniref:hypothetical protein n=1 Tax=Bacillus mycoides TaxID=1405 RepID=UPI003A7FFF5F
MGKPDHGVFLSVDSDPGDEDDPVTQNGYTYAISYYKKNKTLKGMNKKGAFVKTTARGFVGGIIGGTGGRLAKAATLGRKRTMFLSAHTRVSGYAVATSRKDYSGKGLGRDLAYSMTGNKGYVALNYATTYYENRSKKKSTPKKKQSSKKRKR